jgi:hypothetical protein
LTGPGDGPVPSCEKLEKLFGVLQKQSSLREDDSSCATETLRCRKYPSPVRRATQADSLTPIPWQENKCRGSMAWMTPDLVRYCFSGKPAGVATRVFPSMIVTEFSSMVFM